MNNTKHAPEPWVEKVRKVWIHPAGHEVQQDAPNVFVALGVENKFGALRRFKTFGAAAQAAFAKAKGE